MMNIFEERNFIQPMGNAIMFSRCHGFFLLSFGFRVGRLQVGEEVFFFKCMWCGEWNVQNGHWTFHASFIGGGPGGAGGEDLFSFQPIRGPKVSCFYSF